MLNYSVAELRKSKTITSVTKSDSEWTASAIMALLCPNTPAINLKTNSRKLARDPIKVTAMIFLFLICSFISLGPVFLRFQAEQI